MLLKPGYLLRVRESNIDGGLFGMLRKYALSQTESGPNRAEVITGGVVYSYVITDFQFCTFLQLLLVYLGFVIPCIIIHSDKTNQPDA
jgi:hypothetical protein